MKPRNFLSLAAAGLAALVTGCSPPAAAPAKAPPAAGKLRLDGVTVVDTRSGKLTPGMSILMDHGRILSVTPTAATPIDPAVQTVDATGKFVTPGFNDMHAHPFDSDPTETLALMLADGVTGVRQMSGSPELLKARREKTLRLGPDAPALLIMPGAVLTPFNAGSVEEAVAEIHRQKAQGADFIKVAIVSRPVFFASIRAAKQVGLPAVGHLAAGVGPAEASRAGFRSIEHLGPGDGVWIACSTDERALQAEAAKRPALKAPPFKLPGFAQKLVMGRLQKVLINPAAFSDPIDVARTQRALDTYSPQKCHALAAQLAADGNWQVPTLVRLRTQELADLPEYDSDPSLRYMDAKTVKAWREVNERFRKLPAATLATYRETYGRQLKLTKLFDEAGVRMMAGTDNGGQVPGQSLHQEFDELAKAGLSPLRILQMTTLNGAEFLGRTATMGTVEAGKNADLVLLDADPNASVQNLHRISGVVRAGVYRSRADLDALRKRFENKQSN